ncbi:MAG TPA: BTAD domain-containing putative transcriptional regulator [Ktedonobacteraceae bacterium]|nr:BTAD domain-containing putative transcriptional regulator [Ktedonobacteraceae bacterium]
MIEKTISTCYLNSFIGREQEIVRIIRQLAHTRLLTITGPGGSGKTRLALQVATEMTKHLMLDVKWLDLVTLTDPALLPHALATLLGINEQPECSVIHRVLDHLRFRKVLLVLDNCEHLVEACANITSDLLHACQDVSILATSREVLHTLGETQWLLPPLHLPDLQQLPPLEDLMQYEALQLFVERAMATRSSFEITQENATIIASICCRLEGIPLAIELAAARVNVLSIRQIMARLDDICQLLSGGGRRMLPRHQTIRITIGRSYNLLTEKEKLLFCRLSVFPGYFSLEAAESICTGGEIVQGEVLDLLARLVDKSLLVAEEIDGEMHYRFLKMIYHYSQEMLQKMGEEALLRERYQNWCLEKPSGHSVKNQKALLRQASFSPFTDIKTHQKKSVLAPARGARKAQSRLRILAFGPTQVFRDKYELTSSNWKYKKARELFCYLLSHRGKSKEHIGLALWPDSSSDQLRDYFHSALYHLRNALGNLEWIRFENNLYFFNRQLDYWFDVEVFEDALAQAQKLLPQVPTQAISKLEEAVDLYRGDCFEDLFDGNWYQLQRKNLRQKYQDALLTLGQLYSAEKQYTQAAQAYSQLITHDSFLEIAHRELIRCYERLGERGQALRHYQTFVQMMKEELGALPTNETTLLIERLRRGEVI